MGTVRAHRLFTRILVYLGLMISHGSALQVIAKKIRLLMGIDGTGTSQFKTQKDPKFMYFEQKKHTGRKVDNLSYRIFYKKNARLFE